MTGTVYTCLHTNQSRSYLNHLVYVVRQLRVKNARSHEHHICCVCYNGEAVSDASYN